MELMKLRYTGSYCEIVDEWIEIFHRDNEALPPPTIGKNIEEFLNGT